MRKSLLLAASLAAISTPALADNGMVEAQLGYDAPSAGGSSASGLTYGATLAYEMPIDDSVFLGAEISIDDSTAKECGGSRTLADPRFCASFGRDLGAALRFGADLSEKSTIYGIIGYSNARVSVTIDDGVTPLGGSANADGIKLGAGFRQYLTKGTYAKVEYRYTNYEGGLERHQGLVGVGYQF